MTTDTLTILLTALGLMFLMVLVMLLILLWKSQQQNRTTLLALLSQQVTENQSLRDQLRAGDPMTLHALRAATTSSPNSEDYIPTHDEALLHEERLRQSEFTETGLSDDLAASGWETVTVRDSGGSPVNFGQTD